MVLQEQFLAIADILKCQPPLVPPTQVDGVAVGGFGLGVSSTKPCWQGGKGMVTLPMCHINPYNIHAVTSSPVLAEKF